MRLVAALCVGVFHETFPVPGSPLVEFAFAR
jgi:hypothetical protein